MNEINEEMKRLERKNRVLEALGYKKNENGEYTKEGVKTIIYMKLLSGLIVKIDIVNFTGYRLNKEKMEWQEDSVLYTEYEYGELDGEKIDLDENYAYGEPYQHGVIK